MVLALVLLLASMPGLAQYAADQPANEASQEAVPEDVLGRGTPRGSIAGFFKAAEEPNWEAAAEYLDLRNLPSNVKSLGGVELARQFHHVLTRLWWLDEIAINDSPEGARGDGLPPYRDELIRVPMPDGEVSIWLQRVPREDGEFIWKISNRSVASIPELYDQYSYSAPVESIRNWFPQDMSFLGIEAFKWFILFAVGLLAWLIFYALGWILARIFSRPSRDNFDHVQALFTGPLVLLAVLLTVGAVLRKLGAGADARSIMEAHTLLTVAAVWFVWALLDLYKKTKQTRLIANDRPGAAKLMQPMTTLIKILVLVFGLLFWLNNIGVNITTVLAGLGVGGLAVALALQKPLEDMMGALTIFSQASVRVGDLCRFGSTVGWIEDIGLRTTRVRTLTNSVVSVPNSQFAYMEIDNLAFREKIRYWPTLRLRYDTRLETIRTICERIRGMLAADENVYEEPLRVRFTDFDDDAILVKIHSFLRTADYPTSLEYREKLNLGIMAIVEEEGARFALPGSSIYLEGEGALAQP
jgi:MscS family membrane protein